MWTCGSMKPGVAVNPCASMTVALGSALTASALTSPMKVICCPSMRMSCFRAVSGRRSRPHAAMSPCFIFSLQRLSGDDSLAVDLRDGGKQLVAYWDAAGHSRYLFRRTDLDDLTCLHHGPHGPRYRRTTERSWLMKIIDAQESMARSLIIRAILAWRNASREAIG